MAQAKAYLANPSASMLAQLQNQIVTFQQQVNTALLAGGEDRGFEKPAACAGGDSGRGDDCHGAFCRWCRSISSKAQVAQMAAHVGREAGPGSAVLDESRAAAIVAEHYGEPVELARVQVAQAEQAEMRAGF